MKHLLILTFIFIPLISPAQKEKIDLDPVTVTASLTQNKISQSGRDITVIKGESFQNLPVHSLDELLRYVPGIEVQQRGPQGTQSDLLIRGGTFQQVLVIIDGIRLNDPLTGHFNSYIPITPSEIDRIEVMKGAASAIYGSDAVGGVIHIITKTFSQQHHKNTLSVSATAGEYGLLNVNAGGYYHKNKLALSAGVLSNNASGQLQRGINGYFHNNTLSGSLKYQIKKWQVGLQSSYDKRDFAAQNFYTAFTSDTATEKVTTWWNHIKAAYSHNRDQLSVDAGYKKVNDEYDFNKAAVPNLNKSSVLQSVAVYTRTITPRTKLTVGSQFINRSIKSNDRGDHAVNTLAGFVLLHQKFGNHFHISPAIRYEKSFIPQLNLSYRIKKILLRASGGKTIRDADFTERYNNYGKTLVTSGNIGNDALEAESSWTFEIGADYFVADHLKLSATFFAKYYDDLIDWVNTPYADMPRKNNLSPSGNYFLAKNISELTTTGIETSVQYQSKSFNGNIGVTILNSSATSSLYISSHAKWILNYSLLYHYKFLRVAVNGLYKKRQSLSGNASLASLSSDYYVMNVRLGATIKKFHWFVQTDNMLDRHYADRFGVPMPGRWLSSGLTISLAPSPVK
jgi:iron complex outermembrane receptor protein